MESPMGELTDLLQRWRAGNEAAGERLIERLYPQLRSLAALRLAGHEVSLQITELVHELYIKLAGSEQPNWEDRRHFLAIAARKMRQLVVDHARKRRRLKRGGPVADLPLDQAQVMASPQPQPLDLLALDRSMNTLEALLPEAVRIVELRFFAGFDVREAADIMGISPTSVKRRWRFAQAWLRRSLEEGEPDES